MKSNKSNWWNNIDSETQYDIYFKYYKTGRGIDSISEDQIDFLWNSWKSEHEIEKPQ